MIRLIVSTEGHGSSRVLLRGKISAAAGLEEGRMAQEWAKAFYRSKRWMKCRDAYIQGRIMADGGLCEECRDKPGYIVHHKNMLTAENVSDPEVSLNHWNLKYVCRDCHDLYGGHGLNKAAKPLCTFDGEGQPVSLRRIDRK